MKFIFILFLKIYLSSSECITGKNLCTKCNLITKLCIKCDLNIYSPDENGGCKYAHKCEIGLNQCDEFNENGDLCKKCVEGYFPDENGGCSYTNNCEISYDGECLKCKENYILIGLYTVNGDFIICKSLNSEDLRNCEKIDIENGICQECKQGFYPSTDERRCSQTENCYESTFGVCNKCNEGLYLDRLTQKCLKQEGAFEHCRETLDGKTCDACDEDYYFDEEHICCGTTFLCYKRR